MTGTDELYLGLISGTSADGIDAALVRFNDAPAMPELVFGRTYPWATELRARLIELGQHSQHITLDEIGELDVRIGQAFAQAAQQAFADSALAPSAVTAIGSHGQTLRHRPSAKFPYTLQLGDPNTIAERTGVQVVADFRRRDVAAGGHGAPLVPGLHAALLHSQREHRAVLNLGGIANLTLLPMDGAVRGFDTGPANGLMDAWCLRHHGQPFDRDGQFAASGQANPSLLRRLLEEPWFAQPPPRSTGRDQFNLRWLETRLTDELAPADVQATLLALSIRTIIDALRASQPDTARLIVCGGGVHNMEFMSALSAALPSTAVESTQAHGIDPDFIESMAFAWLARRTLHGLPGNVESVTGAAGPRVLGAVYPA